MKVIARMIFGVAVTEVFPDDGHRWFWFVVRCLRQFSAHVFAAAKTVLFENYFGGSCRNFRRSLGGSSEVSDVNVQCLARVPPVCHWEKGISRATHLIDVLSNYFGNRLGGIACLAWYKSLRLESTARESCDKNALGRVLGKFSEGHLGRFSEGAFQGFAVRSSEGFLRVLGRGSRRGLDIVFRMPQNNTSCWRERPPSCLCV